jgi:hypothetical protein
MAFFTVAVVLFKYFELPIYSSIAEAQVAALCYAQPACADFVVVLFDVFCLQRHGMLATYKCNVTINATKVTATCLCN